MSENELLSLLTLQRIPNIGDISMKKLLNKMGSAEAVLNAKTSGLLQIPGIGQLRVKEFKDPAYRDEAEAELRFIQQEKIEVFSFEEKQYPERLKQCIDAPVLLFQKGNVDLQNKLLLSIVGTRKATTHGVAFVEKLVEELAPLKPVIISGFAYGIDIAAQKAALKNNLQTVGCLAHGLNQTYPKAHAKYRNQIEENGGFLSDFWSDINFDRKNFIKRNRIIAGLSEATLVIESAEKGGSLITADIANSYDREVFAVPGRPTDSQSKGCNNLIKSHQAQAVTSAADIIYLLNWDVKPTHKTIQPTLFVDLNPEEETILNELKQLGKTELDVLALNCQMPTYKVASLLLNLELNGIVRPLPGKQFEAI